MTGSTPEFSIGGQSIGPGYPTYLIAEIGSNHGGDVTSCLHMIDAAQGAGANAAKLQRRDVDHLYAPILANQAMGAAAFGRTYLEHRQRLELSDGDWKRVVRHAHDLDFTLFATPFDLVSLARLVDLGVPAIKVASADSRCWPLLDAALATGLPVVVSTGGLDWGGVAEVAIRRSGGHHVVALLQCTAVYPTPPGQVDLRVIPEMARRFPDVVVGYSGHEIGMIPTLGAVSLGASVVERHFTLSGMRPGTDQALSLDAKEFASLVGAVRDLEAALGSSRKERSAEEASALWKLGKGAVAARDLAAGSVLEPHDIELRSPAEGVAPSEIQDIVGRRLARSIQSGEPIKRDMIS